MIVVVMKSTTFSLSSKKKGKCFRVKLTSDPLCMNVALSNSSRESTSRLRERMTRSDDAPPEKLVTQRVDLESAPELCNTSRKGIVTAVGDRHRTNRLTSMPCNLL